MDLLNTLIPYIAAGLVGFIVGGIVGFGRGSRS